MYALCVSECVHVLRNALTSKIRARTRSLFDKQTHEYTNQTASITFVAIHFELQTFTFLCNNNLIFSCHSRAIVQQNHSNKLNRTCREREIGTVQTQTNRMNKVVYLLRIWLFYYGVRAFTWQLVNECAIPYAVTEMHSALTSNMEYEQSDM